jgi:hypothetical protein
MRNYTTETKQIIMLVSCLKTCFLVQRITMRGKWALCQKSAFLELISYNNILYSRNTISTETKFLDINVTTLLQAVHIEVLADLTETKLFSEKEFLDINLTKDSDVFAPCYSQSFLQKTKHFLEVEFLDINMTEDLCLLLHAIHSPFYWRILQKTENYSVLKIHA